jgi:hypothetical protein
VSGGEEDAVKVQSPAKIERLRNIDAFRKCHVDGCMTNVLPAGEKCQEHGGQPTAEIPSDEGWGETGPRTTKWFVFMPLDDECE